MLYTDRDFVTIDDVITIDPDVADVSAVENIPTEGDASFVHQAIEEGANTILSLMQNFSYYFGASAITQQVYLFPTYDSTPPARITLGQVVVDSDTTTFWSPMKRWIVYLALRNFYQICSNRKLDDKYDKKLQQIQKDIDNKYFPAFKAAGVPICYTPVPCPGAKYELNTGTWDDSNVTEVPGGSAQANTWDVGISWVTTAGESGPSETVTVNIDQNNLISIDISSLNPPEQTMAWKVWAGETGKTMFFQAQIPVGTKTFTLSDAPVLSGQMVGRGQDRDVEMTFINAFFRA